MWTWLYAIALLGLVAMICVFGYRRIRTLRDKVDRGDARWEDDWDPFS